MSNDTTPPQTEQQANDLKVCVSKESFEQFLSALAAIKDESLLEVNKSGFNGGVCDPANVAACHATLNTSAFESFNASKQTYGLSTRDVHRIVETIDYPTANLNFQSEYNKLHLDIGPYEYNNHLTNPENIRKAPNIQDLDLDFVAQINIDLLRTAVNWFNEFTTHIRIGYDTNNTEFWVKATEMQLNDDNDENADDGCFRQSASNLHHVESHGTANSMFSLDYFKDIIDAIPDNTIVKVEFGEKYPMRLSYEIGKNNETHGEVEFIQAPRVPKQTK